MLIPKMTDRSIEIYLLAYTPKFFNVPKLYVGTLDCNAVMHLLNCTTNGVACCVPDNSGHLKKGERNPFECEHVPLPPSG